METVNFLAELYGFSLIVVGLAFLIRPKNIETLFALVQNDAVLFLVGVINVVLGVALVLTYNVWDSSWKTLITIFAWLVLVRGILILFWPDKIRKIIEKHKNRINILQYIFVGTVILGCVLVYLSQNF